MELKELSLQDRERITALYMDVFTREPWNDDWSCPGQLDAYITELAGQQNSLTFGYFDGDRLIGVAMGHIRHWHEGTEYCIDEFCIARDMQRQGHGGRFLQCVEDQLLERGIPWIFLLTDRHVPAYEFYLRHGFRELHTNACMVRKAGAPHHERKSP
jgi:aminoglycoside 6'-N-acetyltransferase I